MSKNNSNILCVGDTHLPAMKEGYLDFCNDVMKKYKCGIAVHMGDVFDFHGISYHEREMDAPSISQEVAEDREKIIPWTKVFKKMRICIGNHDDLIFRKAKTHGFSKDFFKTWNEIFDLPNTWEWSFSHKINDVLFIHGKGYNGVYPHANAMQKNRTNIVIGHCHSVCGIEKSACSKDLLWGMAVGCGVDDKHLALRYGTVNPKKSVISCGVIAENGTLPFIVSMPL